MSKERLMGNLKNFRWLRSIKRATSINRDLIFEISRNPDTSKMEDKFIYSCRHADGKLLFDRRIDFGTAMIAVNSWVGEITVEE